MISVQTWLDESALKTLLIMQVHDELVLEVPVSELELVKSKLPELMQSVGKDKLDIPLVVEVGVGDNWDKAH